MGLGKFNGMPDNVFNAGGDVKAGVSNVTENGTFNTKRKTELTVAEVLRNDVGDIPDELLRDILVAMTTDKKRDLKTALNKIGLSFDMLTVENVSEDVFSTFRIYAEATESEQIKQALDYAINTLDFNLNKYQEAA